MDSFTLDLRRCWIVRALGRSPLVRTSDRVEALVILLVFVLALVTVPFAGAIGTAAYETLGRAYASESLTRHTVAATAIEDSTVTAEQAMGPTFRVKVRWHAGGAQHVDWVELLPHEVKPGDRLDIWVDNDGRQVGPPTPMWRAGVEAVLVATATWVTAVAGAAGLSALMRTRLRRRRYRGWDRQWHALARDGGGRAGSQT